MNKFKKFIIQHKRLYDFFKVFKKHKNSKFKLVNHGIAQLTYKIQGNNNEVYIEENTTIWGSSIFIKGNNNKIYFGKNCRIGNECSFWLIGNNVSIIIKDNTTFTWKIHLNAAEDNSNIIINEDCMLSNNIIIRTSDDHPIFDKDNIRINPAKNVLIEKHVWIAPNSKIMKGALIGSGSIIGSNTLVTKAIPKNTLAVGYPAKVIKRGISWSRHF